jgi:type I restriction enzyme M protein
MALKKSDLYSSLWKSCDELRGGMDASQYKDYILTLLFVKYVSDKAKSDPNSLIDVPEGGSFDDMLAAKGDKEIGDRFNKIIAVLAEANGLQKVIDVADFDDEEKLGKGKEMQDRLSNLVAIFADLDFRGSKAEGDDLLGDAYEYLMRHFATESGKSKGQFYTPAEVSRILAKVVGIGPDTKQDQTVYDPTCGSGSLLLKAAAEAPRGVTIYGQEKDNATWALSKMNMILHGNEVADLRKGDTLTSPQFTKNDQLQTFDFIVMNPPFSVKSWSNGLDRDYGRFELGRPPAKNGDYAFLLHAIKSLKSAGKAAIILPHGVLFRGGAEATIRKELIKRGYIKGIIGLPPNLFYGTGIPACVVVIDKEHAASRTAVFMIDAAKGYIKDGNKNRLRAQDIHKIVDYFNKRIESERFSRLVPIAEITDAKNDCNLNLPRYIDSSEPEDLQDLEGHLQGGIPQRDVDALQRYWDAFPSLRNALFENNRPDYVDLVFEPSAIQSRILESHEFKELKARVRSVIEDWWRQHHAILEAVSAETKPAELITALSEDLLSRTKDVPLLDEYDAYDQLMNYWNSVMHDDVFLVMNAGWGDAAKPRKTIVDKDRKISEDPDLVVGAGKSTVKYKVDLVPPAVVIEAYFEDRQAEVDRLTAEAEAAGAAITEHAEEYGGEEALLSEATNDKGAYTKALLKKVLDEAKENNDAEAFSCAEKAMDLLNAEVAAKKALKDEIESLNTEVLKKYGTLTAEDARQLVLDRKWIRAINGRISGEVKGLSGLLVARLKELSQRYNKSLPKLNEEVEALAARVDEHLRRMGASWT